MKHAPAWRHRALRAAAASLLVAGFAGFGVQATGQAAPARSSTISPSIVSTPGCNLGGTVQHVISIQFDNVHLFRDNQSGNPKSPQYNVPSDLEQMPHLLNFMEQNGFISSNHHTPLIAHTGTDILTTLTGLYPDHFGVPIANSYKYYTGNPINSAIHTGATFAYWTDPVYDLTTGAPSTTDHSYNMVTPNGQNTPAPWVPFTRAGCNVGDVGVANTVIENMNADVPQIFGNPSPENTEMQTNLPQATADFEGLAVHCAAGDWVCASGRNDPLPDEPGGYYGYNALFGAKYIDNSINGGAGIQDLNGNTIQDASGNVGFPGFDGMSAAVSLGYVAKMQESGIPVTYAYISDAHDQHLSSGNYAMGPGNPTYENVLHSYDQAFQAFFSRLAADGITPANTEFIFTADENDNFVGGQPSPSNCNGITIMCNGYGGQGYAYLGELNVNLSGLLFQERNNNTPFTLRSDSAPNVYVAGNPSQTDPAVRQLERDTAALTVTNPLTGVNEHISNYIADQNSMTAVHMMSSDAARNPTFTMFAKPDYYMYASGTNCNAQVNLTPTSCLTEPTQNAYNHGDFADVINNTWLGMAGPGIKPNQGWVGAHQIGLPNRAPWSDHTDIRPTLLALTHLQDDYVDDGRVLTEFMTPSAIPAGLKGSPPTILNMIKVYKQLNAAVGQFGSLALTIGNIGAVSGSASDDTRYIKYSNAVANDTLRRDQIVAQMLPAITNAEFNGQKIQPQWANSMTRIGQLLLYQMTNEARPAPTP